MFDKHFKAFNEEDQKVNKYLKLLSQITSGAGMSVPRIADALKVHEDLGRQYRDTLKKGKPSDLKKAVLADKSIRGIDRHLTDDIDAIVEMIKTLTAKRLKETELIAKTQMEAYQALSFFIIFLILAGVCFGIFNAWSIARDLSLGKNGKGVKTEEVE